MKAAVSARLAEAARVLDDEALALADDAARAAGHLGDGIRTEALHDLVERTGHGRERGEPLDELVASRDRFTALDGLPVAENGPGGEIALAVGEELVQLHRERMLQIG